MEKRIPGYARVSSREQAENSHALEQQIARLKAAGATEIYFDVES
jgi:site-specific DNA recombinase